MGLWPRREPEPAPEPTGSEWSAEFEAFLDQGRWLLDEQHRRSECFLSGAVGVLGFDGAILAILAGSNFLTSKVPLVSWSA